MKLSADSELVTSLYSFPLDTSLYIEYLPFPSFFGLIFMYVATPLCNTAGKFYLSNIYEFEMGVFLPFLLKQFAQCNSANRYS